MKTTANQEVIYGSQGLPIIREIGLERDSEEIEWITFLVKSCKVDVLKRIAGNPDTDANTLATLAHNVFPDVRAEVADNPNTPFATLLLLSRDADADVRVRLACSHTVPSVVLLILADDRNEYVRWQAKTTLKHIHWRNKLRTAMHE